MATFSIPTTTKQWIRGVVQSFIQAAASGVGVVIVAPETFNLNAGAGKLIEVCVVFGIVGLAGFLKTHPVPDSDPSTLDS